MQPFIVTTAVYIAVGLLCLSRPNAGRIVAGVFFLAMGIGVHGYMIVAYPHGYIEFAENAHFGFYRDLTIPIVELSPRGVGLLVAAFEVTAGALMLSRGVWVRLGLWGAIAFLVVIAPHNPLTVPNLILAVALGYLLTVHFDRSLWTSVTDRLSRGHKRADSPQPG